MCTCRLACLCVLHTYSCELGCSKTTQMMCCSIYGPCILPARLEVVFQANLLPSLTQKQQALLMTWVMCTPVTSVWFCVNMCTLSMCSEAYAFEVEPALFCRVCIKAASTLIVLLLAPSDQKESQMKAHWFAAAHQTAAQLFVRSACIMPQSCGSQTYKLQLGGSKTIPSTS